MTIQEFTQELRKVFTDKQIIALQQCVVWGGWGDCDMEFKEEDGEWHTSYAWGCITNDTGIQSPLYENKKQFSGVFRGVVKKVKDGHPYLTYIQDWWEDGSGNVIFFNLGKLGWKVIELEKWAREKI